VVAPRTSSPTAPAGRCGPPADVVKDRKSIARAVHGPHRPLAVPVATAPGSVAPDVRPARSGLRPPPPARLPRRVPHCPRGAAPHADARPRSRQWNGRADGRPRAALAVRRGDRRRRVTRHGGRGEAPAPSRPPWSSAVRGRRRGRAPVSGRALRPRHTRKHDPVRRADPCREGRWIPAPVCDAGGRGRRFTSRLSAYGRSLGGVGSSSLRSSAWAPARPCFRASPIAPKPCTEAPKGGGLYAHKRPSVGIPMNPSLAKEEVSVAPARATSMACLQELFERAVVIECLERVRGCDARRCACPPVPASPKMYPSRTRGESKSRHHGQHNMPICRAFLQAI
jgi:hypothetical protein